MARTSTQLATSVQAECALEGGGLLCICVSEEHGDEVGDLDLLPQCDEVVLALLGHVSQQR